MKRDYGYWEFNQNSGAHTDVPVIHFEISADDKNKYSSFSNREFMDKIQKPGDSGCNVQSSEFFKETVILFFMTITTIKGRILTKERQGDFCKIGNKILNIF
jgi:hypothetical protein